MLFWKGHWLNGINQLGDFAIINSDENYLNQKLNEFVANGSWNWNTLNQMLLSDCLELFNLIKAPEPRASEDVIA